MKKRNLVLIYVCATLFASLNMNIFSMRTKEWAKDTLIRYDQARRGVLPALKKSTPAYRRLKKEAQEAFQIMPKFRPKLKAYLVSPLTVKYDQILVSGSLDRTVKIWDMNIGYVGTLKGNRGPVHSVAFSFPSKFETNSKYLASGSKLIRIWDARNWERKEKLEDHWGAVNSVAFSPDPSKDSGQGYLASGSQDSTVKIWDTNTWLVIKILKDHLNSGAVYSVAFSPNLSKGLGQAYLASGSQDGMVKIWDTNTWKCKKILKDHLNSGTVYSVAFSPNPSKGSGQVYLASGSQDGTVKIWDTNTWKCKKILKDHLNSGTVYSVAFSPNPSKGSGQVYLASGSEDGTVKIWDTNTWKCEKILKGHGGAVNSVAFSSDHSKDSGQAYLVSGSEDGTVKIWNTKTWECERIFKGHKDAVRTVAFMPKPKKKEREQKMSKMDLQDRVGFLQDKINETLEHLKKEKPLAQKKHLQKELRTLKKELNDLLGIKIEEKIFGVPKFLLLK